MKTISYRDYINQLMSRTSADNVPVIGTFELTPLCNLDCRMCYVHMQDPSVRDRMLGGEQWISIMKEAVDCGMSDATLTGGEAMTHPDFREIYMFLLNRGVSLTVKTNGILLNGENISFFGEYPPAMIDVSLYGCNPESYVAVTGHDVFETVTGNIRAAVDAGLHLRIMVTPNEYMSPWTERVMELAWSFGVEINVNDLLIEPQIETGRKKEDFNLKEDEYALIRAKKKELQASEPVPDERDAESGENPAVSAISPKGLRCSGGRSSFAVNWDGTMSPCISFPREIVCAEPLRDGFSKAWEEVNACARNYEIPKECLSCGYNMKCRYCPTQHGRYSVSHMCDPDVCAHWKSFYGEAVE